MSIDYEILLADGRSKAVWGSACWASFPRKLRELDTTGAFRCRLILDDRSEYMKNTPLKYRNLSDQVFDKLFGKWMHPDWWISEHNTPNRKARTGVVYTSVCPYWVMVASGSVYRMHYDFASFLYHWEQLDKVQKEVGYRLRPWTQYFMCVSISNHNTTSVDFLKDAAKLGVINGHMIIDGRHASIESIQHLSGWTHELVKQGDGVHHHIPSMYAEWQESGGALSYIGRDHFFTGFPRLDREGYNENFIAREGAAAGMRVKDKANPYCTSVTAHIPEFIEKVCIPNQL